MEQKFWLINFQIYLIKKSVPTTLPPVKHASQQIYSEWIPSVTKTHVKLPNTHCHQLLKPQGNVGQSTGMCDPISKVKM